MQNKVHAAIRSTVILAPSAGLSVRLSPAVRAKVNCKVSVSGMPELYTGEYDVTPLVTSQVMPTRDKFLVDDMRIDMIPTREINNAAGGVTFIVG